MSRFAVQCAAFAIVTLALVVAIVASTANASRAKAAPVFSSSLEMASYALGVNFATQLKTISIEIDADAMLQGFNDARAGGGKTRLTQQQLDAALDALRKQYQQQSAGAAGLSIFFKIDPRLAGGTYGGTDRWASPATYTRVGNEDRCVIEARAQVTGAGKMTVSPQWKPSDPDMIDVTPSEGGAVTITVKRAGASSIHVNAGTVSKELAVTANLQNNVLQVEISQK